MRLRLSRSAVESGFHLRLSVPSEGIGGRPAEFDIRQLRDDDIVPCDSLWNRKASSVLARMNFPPVLRDELPVIALRDSNHVLCFYGVSISAPFYVSAPQHANISFGKDAVPSDERREYVVRVIGT
ncbi:C-terminal processing peptidase family protein [Babesia caballi]|uniref:C-terminal processing peptidase family protein n=1 Tax=Babesia caballi TaxID=5871 RepID=A0AAV4LZ77_BABCB|nr:C-terminal processing peptidase family protein [Babesia caballi]